MTTIIVRTEHGDAFIRADSAEALGIRPGEAIGRRLYDLAVQEDYDRNRADRRKRMAAA